jgi:hypothetical protein
VSLPLAVAPTTASRSASRRASALSLRRWTRASSPAMALQALGVPYEAPGGGALQKLHLATYLAILALVLEAAARRVARAPFAFLAQRRGSEQ